MAKECHARAGVRKRAKIRGEDVDLAVNAAEK